MGKGALTCPLKFFILFERGGFEVGGGWWCCVYEKVRAERTVKLAILPVNGAAAWTRWKWPRLFGQVGR